MPELPAAATVLVAPAGPDDGAFAGVVGAYAAGLDEGTRAAEAFRAAVGSRGLGGARALDLSGALASSRDR